MAQDNEMSWVEKAANALTGGAVKDAQTMGTRSGEAIDKATGTKNGNGGSKNKKKKKKNRKY